MLAELRNLPAPAKLNLFLHVTGRRSDGYHDLETVFQFVDLADRIDLALRADGQISRETAPDGVPEALDLTLRAARALQAATDCPLGATICLRKAIPVGAGLGGGSSDAATVLLGLNRLWGLGLDRSRLLEIARPLGADVPVFVRGRNAYATGTGDRLRPVRLPQRWFVLLMPPVSVPTAGIFADPKLTRSTKPITISGFSRHGKTSRSGELAGRNDLQPVVTAKEPAVQSAVAALTRAARQTVGNVTVRMTGSGACVFAALDSIESARALAGRLRASQPSSEGQSSVSQNVGTVHLVAGLAEHPLGSRQVG